MKCSLPGGRITLTLCLAGALAVNGALAVISHFPEPRIFFGDEVFGARYLPGAVALAAGTSWHPDPLWPPLYYHLLAGILAVGGGSLVWVELIQCLMLLAIALLLADLSRQLSGSRIAGAVAGWLVLVYPPLVAFAHYLWPELLHLLLFVAALWTLVQRSHRLPWLAVAGILLGLALLTKGLLGPFLPVLLLPLVLTGTVRQRLLRITMVALGIGLVISPVVLTSRHRASGVLNASSATFNLWLGLNDRSPTSFHNSIAGNQWRTYLRSAPTFAERDQVLRSRITAFISERGVMAVLRQQLGRQYFRLLDKGSYLTVQLPGGPIAANGQGYRDPPALLHSSLRWSSYGLYALLLVAAVIGISVCPHRGRHWLLVGLAFFAYNLALYLLLHVKSRFRIQLLPFLFLYAGCTVAWLIQRFGSGAGAGSHWKKKIAPWAWPVAALLLGLAFAGPWLA